MKQCRCASCVFTDKVARIQRKLSAKDRAVIEELLNKWAHAGMDAAYYRAKLDGTWPEHNWVSGRITIAERKVRVRR